MPIESKIENTSCTTKCYKNPIKSNCYELKSTKEVTKRTIYYENIFYISHPRDIQNNSEQLDYVPVSCIFFNITSLIYNDVHCIDGTSKIHVIL